MKMPSKFTILFNGAALLLVGGSIAAVVRSMLFAEDVAACSERYAAGTRMSLDQNGEPLTAIDLQARVAGTDWGLLESTRVVKLKGGPAEYALELDLARTRAVADGPDRKAGVGFVWAPQRIGKARSACLSYAVLLPEGFEFGRGGRLPGMMGAPSDKEPVEGDDQQFSTRYTWKSGGTGDVVAMSSGWSNGRTFTNARHGFGFPRGKWIAFEQEIVLNAASKKDGILRVWVDGALTFENTSIDFAENPMTAISGVLAEAVAFAPEGAARSSKEKSQKILITPFELRWK